MDKTKDEKTSEQGATPFAQTYFHGTKFRLKNWRSNRSRFQLKLWTEI